MLENTLSIFVISSVYFIILSIKKKSVYGIMFSGILLFLGFLSKGLVALFPWSLIFFIYLFKKNISFKNTFFYTLILFLFTLIPLVFIYFILPEGFKSISIYLQHQVLGSIKNAKTVNSRFYISSRLIREISLPILISLIVLYIGKTEKIITKKVDISWSFIFLFLGLSGVIPIMVSLKQRGFYILATFPFFAISLAYLIKDYTFYLLTGIDIKSKFFNVFQFLVISIFVTALILNFVQIGRIGRDKKLVKDVYNIIGIIPHNTTISISSDMWTAWSVHGYFARYANISLDPKNKHKYFLVFKNKKI